MSETTATYSIQEVAKKLGKSKATVYNWVKNGELEGFMGKKDGFVGRPGILITEDSVNRLMKRIRNIPDLDIKTKRENEKIKEMENMLDLMSRNLQQMQINIACMRIGLTQMKEETEKR